MTMNRVQFQRGLSMAEFMNLYASDEQCETALIASRWPHGFACPGCGCSVNSSFRREGRLYWQCSACRHQCSVISGTRLRVHQTRPSPMVPGHAPADPVEEQ